jgi:hypothetical protein
MKGHEGLSAAGCAALPARSRLPDGNIDHISFEHHNLHPASKKDSTLNSIGVSICTVQRGEGTIIS